MVDQIVLLHKKEYNVEPEVLVSAPGKISIMGEHTEYADGYIMAMAIDRRVYVAVSARQDNSLRFFSGNLEERKRSTIAGLKYRREDRWANYPKGIIASLLNLGCAFKGVNVTILGNIPMGIGLASSSALEVALTVAFQKLYQWELSDAQVIETARQTESIFLNSDSGIFSPLVSYYAKEGTALFLDTRSLHVDYYKFPGDCTSILITDSKILDSMSHVEKISFRNSCKDCLHSLGGGTFRDIGRDDLSGSVEGLSERNRRIGIHIVEENVRVIEARKNLIKNDMEDVGKLISRSHESLGDMLEISCPELDWLVKRGIETRGVYGSRMIGNGYGGCTFTLLHEDYEKDYQKHLEEYDRIFGFKAAIFSVKPSGGIQVHIP